MIQSQVQRENQRPRAGSEHQGTRALTRVGNLKITGRLVWGRTAPNNYRAWFADAQVFYVHTARTAIYKAFGLLGLSPGDEILVPAYHCGSEVDALIKAGACVRLYRVSPKGEIDPHDLQHQVTRATKAIYAIHYFGFAQNLAPLVAFCRQRGLYLIEDCALSLLTEVEGRRIGFWGDLAIYNFPKFLPVPDGGALVVNNPALTPPAWRLKPPGGFVILGRLLQLFKQNVLGCLPGSSVKFLRSLRTTSKPETGMSSERLPMPPSYYFHPAMSNRAWSRTSAWFMENIDLAEVRQCRRRNFFRLLKHLPPKAGLILPFEQLPEGVCPLCLPVLVPRARHIALQLRLHSVPAIAWWAGYHGHAFNWQEFPEACFLKDNLLALSVHQQLGENALQFMGRQLEHCLAAA